MNQVTSEAAFERFLSDEDKLSSLLRATPGFEPPENMTIAFAELAKTAQAEHHLSAQSLNFEPSAQLEQAFLREAASIQAAQAPRREAVLHQLAQGESPRAVLGADVTEATRAWLERQRPVVVPKTPPQKSRLSKLLPQFGLAFSAAIVASVATYAWLHPEPEIFETAALESVVPQMEQAPLSMPASPTVERAIQKKSAEIVSGNKQEKSDALRERADMPAKSMVLAEPNVIADQKEMARHEAKQAVSEAAKDRPMEVAVGKIESRPAISTQASRDVQADAVASATGLGAAGGAPAAAPPPVSVMPSERSSVVPAAAPRPAPMSPAAPVALAKSRQAGAPPISYNAWLSDDTGPIADKIASSLPGRQLRIAAFSPDRPGVKEWAERLRLALPSDSRPAEINLDADAQLAPDTLRIELR